MQNLSFFSFGILFSLLICNSLQNSSVYMQYASCTMFLSNSSLFSSCSYLSPASSQEEKLYLTSSDRQNCILACCQNNQSLIALPDLQMIQECQIINENALRVGSGSNLSIIIGCVCSLFGILIVLCIVRSCLKTQNEKNYEIKQGELHQKEELTVNNTIKWMKKIHQVKNGMQQQIVSASTEPPSILELMQAQSQSNLPKNQQECCSICLEDNPNVEVNCRHLYHAPCIISWLKKSNQCPLCKYQRLNLMRISCVQCWDQYFVVKTIDWSKYEFQSTVCPQCKTKQKMQIRPHK